MRAKKLYLRKSFAVVDTGLYGGTELGEGFFAELFGETFGDGGWQNTVLFELLLMLIQVLLLNLLM